MVHDQVIHNAHKLGDIPFMMNDIMGIECIKMDDHDNLVIVDRKRKVYYLPVNEICYMATSTI